MKAFLVAIIIARKRDTRQLESTFRCQCEGSLTADGTLGKAGLNGQLNLCYTKEACGSPRGSLQAVNVERCTLSTRTADAENQKELRPGEHEVIQETPSHFSSSPAASVGRLPLSTFPIKSKEKSLSQNVFQLRNNTWSHPLNELHRFCSPYHS